MLRKRKCCLSSLAYMCSSSLDRKGVSISSLIQCSKNKDSMNNLKFCHSDADTHTYTHTHTLTYCRASPSYCPVISLFSLTHTFSELNLCVIITWGVDEVAPWLILLDKIVQSEGSGDGRRGGKRCVRGPFSPVRTTVVVFCVWTCSPSGAAYTNDPLSTLSSPWYDGFY